MEGYLSILPDSRWFWKGLGLRLQGQEARAAMFELLLGLIQLRTKRPETVAAQKVAAE